MKEFFEFRQMVSTAIINIIYTLGLVLITIGGIVMLFRGAKNFTMGVGIITLGNLF